MVLDFYGRLLIGQYAGMTQALCLTALVAAFDLEGVRQEVRAQLAARLITIHALFERHRPKKETA